MTEKELQENKTFIKDQRVFLTFLERLLAQGLFIQAYKLIEDRIKRLDAIDKNGS